MYAASYLLLPQITIYVYSLLSPTTAIYLPLLHIFSFSFIVFSRFVLLLYCFSFVSSLCVKERTEKHQVMVGKSLKSTLSDGSRSKIAEISEDFTVTAIWRVKCHHNCYMKTQHSSVISRSGAPIPSAIPRSHAIAPRLLPRLVQYAHRDPNNHQVSTSHYM